MMILCMPADAGRISNALTSTARGSETGTDVLDIGQYASSSPAMPNDRAGRPRSGSAGWRPPPPTIAMRSLSQIVAVAAVQRRESAVTSYESPKRRPVCAVSSNAPTSQCSEPSRSPKRDCRSQALMLFDDSVNQPRIGPRSASDDEELLAQDSCALPVSWTDAILLKAKFVNVAVNVAVPNFAVGLPSLPQ